jgi:predicted transposase YbfD/YdcC
MRGRLEVISHFNNWIKAVTRIKEDDSANRKDNGSRTEEEFLAMLGCSK